MNKLARLYCVSILTLGAFSGGSLQAAPADTPQHFVETYESLADVILGARATERHLVHSIVASAFTQAEGVYLDARGKMQGGKNARAEVEKLATLVAQLGNEGDSAVAAVRKRLIEGGHHHNAAGEAKGLYDEGFVIVTRATKKLFLESAGRIGKLGGGTDAKALEAEWQTVAAEFKKLHEGVASMK